MRRQKRWIEARMSSALFVHTNGFVHGNGLGIGVGGVDLSCDGGFEFGHGLERASSDGAVGEEGEEALAEIADVGVKCTCQRGCLANPLRISLVLWVP